MKNKKQQQKSLILSKSADFIWWKIEKTSAPEELVKIEDNASLFELAKQIYTKEVSLYKKLQSRDKDYNWAHQLITTGTSSDRLAAMTVLVQQSPVHNLEAFQTLIKVANKHRRRDSLAAMETITELVTVSKLLPFDRKLEKFSQRTEIGKNADLRKKSLLLWYYEDNLKSDFQSFIQALQTMSRDSFPEMRKKAVLMAINLLEVIPEEEQILLTLLVNKLGDPVPKVVSTVSNSLLRMVHEKHSLMKPIVIAEVERLLFRPNVSQPAITACINLLTQVILSRDMTSGIGSELASKLINIYLSIFKILVQNQLANSRLLSLILTGLNRAFPYLDSSSKSTAEIESNVNTIYQMVHLLNFNTAVQALMLLYQITTPAQLSSDRFFTTLYRKMTDPQLRCSTKQPLFLSLLSKTLKGDTSFNRIFAFLKRILQISSLFSPSFCAAALLLISEVCKNHDSTETKEIITLEKIINREKSLKFINNQALDDGDEHFVDLPGSDSESELSDKKLSQPIVSSWVHMPKQKDRKSQASYDPLHRNPNFAGAENEEFWELLLFKAHFHPTVSLYAQTLLEGQDLSYDGDALVDFTLMRFLDRFVYRKPKIKADQKKSSVYARKRKQGDEVQVNDDKFINMDESLIPEDKKFFHYFFKDQKSRKRKKTPKDDEEVSDSEFDAFLDKMDGKDTLDFAGSLSSAKKSKTLDDEDEELSDEEVDFGEWKMNSDDDDDEDSDKVQESDEDNQEDLSKWFDSADNYDDGRYKKQRNWELSRMDDAPTNKRRQKKSNSNVKSKKRRKL